MKKDDKKILEKMEVHTNELAKLASKLDISSDIKISELIGRLEFLIWNEKAEIQYEKNRRKL